MNQPDAQPSEHTQTGPGGNAHGTLAQYKMGLILSVILTVIPFTAVWLASEASVLVVSLILLCAVAQIFVQLIFFLHMNTRSENMWNTASAAFVTVIIAIVVLGSIWIMNHLNHNMLMGH